MIQNSNFLTALQLQEQYLKGHNQRSVQETQGDKEFSFQDILKNKADESTELKFSKHAANRLSTRNIELSDSQVLRLQSGMEKANAKGIKDSLVLVDKLAFIVNVPSSTVVTAMDQNEANENIFTNIDGAVIV